MSGWNVGVHVSLGQETGIGVSASGYQSKGKSDGTSTEYVNTRINAKDELSLSSGRDTVLSGAQALGDKITADVGRDLTLSSQQDTDDYHSEQKDVSGGASFTFGSMTGSASLSINKSKIDSEYASVGEQSGLFAGDKGFDVNVGNHTQLNGGVIASTAEAIHNQLSTDTLGWNVIENEASYNASSKGISGGFSSEKDNNGDRVNSGGVLPNIGVSSSGDASGTTQSAIADGTLTLRDTANQTQDVNDLSRDTENANGSIGKIFDKQKIEEQQELAAVFGQMANKYAGDIGANMGWGADSAEKAAIHGAIGAIQASLGGGNALAGGLAGLGSEAFGQLVHNYLTENTTLDAKEKAAITQWAAAVSGAAVGGVVAGSASSGAATSLDSVRYNYLDHKQIEEFAERSKGCEVRGDCQQIVKEMEDLSLKQQQELIAVCSIDPAACKQNYGHIPDNGMLVREAIDRVLGDDVPSKMKNDMSSLLAQQIEAEGVVSSTEFANRLKSQYDIDPQRAELLAAAVLGAVTGGMGKGGNGNAKIAINKGQKNKHIPGTNEYKIASDAGLNKSTLTVPFITSKIRDRTTSW